MKRSWFAALLFAVGCSSSETTQEPAPAGPAAPAAARTKEEQIGNLRARIAQKRADLAQADADLAKIASEREDLNQQPASEAKTNRLAELARVESDTKLKREAVSSNIATLQQQLAELSGTQKPKSADEALDLALEADAKKEKEDAERRRKREEEAVGEEKRKIAEAERAREAERLAKEREKAGIEGGRLAAGADGPGFEERWADVILRVKTELQRYKRW